MAFGLAVIAGCGEAFLNQTASLGGDVAGQRGTVRVLFINNTPYRAVFTYGSYDPEDQFTEPDFAQFRLQDSSTNLDGNSQTALTTTASFITCARVFSIGSPELLRLIGENLPDGTAREEALVDGVEFFQIGGEDGDDEDAEPVSMGSAAPLEAWIGVDFPCNSLLIIRFEWDDLGTDPFRIDYELIPSSSDR